MSTSRKSCVGRLSHQLGSQLRRKSVVASAASFALTALLTSHSAYAASASWNATATDGNWEATGTENNWSTGAGTFPGVHPPANPAANTDVATFGVVSNFTTISINASTPNSDPLNLAGITFTDTAVGVSPSNYIIGSTSGNSLVMTSNAAQGTSTNQIVISGSGRNTTPAPSTAITETINAPIILAAQSSGAGGNFSFQNNSNVLSNTDALVFNGAISAGTMTSAASTTAGNSFGASLTLLGGSTNIANAVNGVISDGGAAGFGGLAVFKNGTGTWTLTGNNTYTGLTTSTGGILRIAGNYSGGGGINITGGGQIQVVGSASPTFGAVNLATGGSPGGITVNTTGTATFGTIGLNGGNSFFTLTAGTAVVGAINENAASASRHVDVNGGTLKITADYNSSPAPGVLNLNGGTITNWKNAPTGGQTLTLDSLLTNSTTSHSINVGANGGSFDTTLGNITSLASLNGTTTTSTVRVIGGNTLIAASTAGSTYIMSVQGTSTWDYNGVAGQVGGLIGSGTVTNSGAAATLTDTFASGTQTFSGNLGGSNAANVSFTKAGAGTQILSGTSSYTGATTVNAGILNVSGSLANTAVAINASSSMIVTGSVAGAVTVNSGGILAGNGNGSTTGSVGSVSFAAGGTLMPGTTTTDGSIGTLAVGTFNGANGTERMDLVTPGASDMIDVTSATFDNTNTFNLLGTPQAGTYTLFSSTNPITYTSDPTVNTPTGTRESFTTSYGTNAITLVVSGNVANLNWTGATNSTWDVNTTVNWFNTGTSAADKFFNLDSVAFPDGAANESITLNSTVQPTAVTFTNNTDTYSIAGTGGITGALTTVTLSGTGKVILATNNTYAGVTNINAGTLQIGSGGTTGTLGTGTVTDNSALIFNRSDSPTLSTTVNGTGSVEQMGGTLIITSSNNWSGTTTIDAGATIQLGDGGGTGNLGSTSGVIDNGTLAFNRNVAGNINAPISGTGSLSVIAGTLSLGANNTYSGTTIIASGSTLQVGTGGTAGSVGTGTLTNNGTLAFNRSDIVTAPTLSGTGALAQNGTGTVVLGAGNTYSGATTVSAGVLAATDPNAFGNTSSVTITNVAGTVSLRGNTSTTFTPPSSGTPYNANLNSAGGTVDVNQATAAGTAAKVMTIGNIDASTSTASTFTLNFTGANNTGLTAGNLLGPASTAAGNVTVNNNNTSGTTTLANYQSNNTAGNDTLTIQGAGNTVLTGGILFGPTDVNVNFNGPGNTTILGHSNYTLNTVIANGTVAIGQDDSFGQSTLNLNAPDPAVGVLQSVDSSTRTLNNPITNSSTNFTFGGTGNLVFNGNWAKGQFPKNLIVNCPVMTINGVISNAPGANGALSKSGPGTLVLTNDNQYDSGTVLNAGTLVAANTGGSATGTGANGDVTLNGGTLASGAGGGLGFIAGNVVAGSGAHIIAPGGIGSIGTFNIGGLTSSNLTTLNFDIGTGTGEVTNGDLLTLGNGTVSIGSGTNVSIAGTTAIGSDYRLIGGSISGISLGNFVLGSAPSGQSYALDATVDPGFIDLVVSSGPAGLTWNNTGGTGDGITWDTTNQNWNNGTGPALFTNGSPVTFNDTNNGHYNVTINTTVNPSSTTVNTSGAYVFSGAGGIGGSGGLTVGGTGSLTLNTANTYTGNTTVNSGATLNVNGSIPATTLNANGIVNFGASSSGLLPRTLGTINLASGGKITLNAASSTANRTVLITSALNFGGSTGAWQGLLDLTKNDLVIHGGSLVNVESQIRQAYNGGNWAGTAGITSSSAAASSSPKTALGYASINGTFDGQAVTTGDVVVKYTLVGDTDLSGSVNFTDLLTLAQHYATSNTVWSTGDFNYDGSTNFTDLLGLAQNYTKALPALTGFQVSQLDSAGGASFAEAFAQAEAQVAVPEPTMLGLLGIGALGSLRRRRRTSR